MFLGQRFLISQIFVILMTEELRALSIYFVFFYRKTNPGHANSPFCYCEINSAECCSKMEAPNSGVHRQILCHCVGLQDCVMSATFWRSNAVRIYFANWVHLQSAAVLYHCRNCSAFRGACQPCKREAIPSLGYTELDAVNRIS